MDTKELATKLRRYAEDEREEGYECRADAMVQAAALLGWAPKLIYLASPYSHEDTRIRDGRFEAVCHAAARLMAEGYLIFSPIAHTHPIALAGKLPTGWEFWQKYDHAQLDAAAELWVLCLSGWDRSKGVKGEIEYMQKLGRPVKYIEPTLAECELGDGRRHHDPQAELKALLARSGMDLSPCMKCGEPVLCLPDGMPMCAACAEGEASR